MNLKERFSPKENFKRMLMNKIRSGIRSEFAEYKTAVFETLTFIIVKKNGVEKGIMNLKVENRPVSKSEMLPEQIENLKTLSPEKLDENICEVLLQFNYLTKKIEGHTKAVGQEKKLFSF